MSAVRNLFPIYNPFMIQKILKYSLLLIIVSLLSSCTSKSKIVYLQDIDQAKTYEEALSYEPLLQADDLLSIIVFADNPEVTIPFNLPQIQGNYEIGNNQAGIKTYLIDNEGYIDFPILGLVKLGGLHRREANAKMVKLVSEYVRNPGINLRILNFKVSVLGEVMRPSTYTIPSERVTLFEALSLAGDLTIYGKRHNILIIREINGVKSYHRVDITKSDFLNSPFYYLAQNDVVMVEPNRTKINSAGVGPNTGIILSSISILITIAVLIFR